MALNMSLEEAKSRSIDFMRRGYHWGPGVLQVMWEAYDWGNEDLLWASTAFNGGIAGQQQAPCGAVSSATVVLGLRHRRPLADKDKAEQARLKAREEASRLVRAFTRKYGTIICRDLLGVDFSKPGELQRFRESGIAREKCDKYVQFVIEKMYELENNRTASEPPENGVI